jgi:hypothetical protein
MVKHVNRASLALCPQASGSPDVVGNFLPGLSSTVGHTATADYLQGHAVVTAAVTAWTTAVCASRAYV